MTSGDPRAPGRPQRISMLDEDPALAAALPEQERELARRVLLAPLVVLPPGRYPPGAFGLFDAGAGMVLLHGLIVRQVGIAGRSYGELIAPPSFLRPWDRSGELAPMPFDLSWHILEESRVALLGERFLAASGRWPAISRVLLERCVERAQGLAISVAIHCLQHVTLRLTCMLWHLADRHGMVTPAGTVLPLRLTHDDLAELVGAQRPTVSKAIGELQRQGRIARRSDRSWLLLGEPPSELTDELRSRRAEPPRAARRETAVPPALSAAARA